MLRSYWCVVVQKYLDDVSVCGVFLYAFAISVGVFSGIYGVQFWIIDDHEIMDFVRFFRENTENATWKNVVDVWFSTEVGSFPDASRFRPGYYFARVLQALIYGEDVRFWFVQNWVVLVTGLTLFGCAIGPHVGWVWTGVVALSLASFPFNRDLWVRLGPAEIGIFLFLQLFVYGASRVVLRRQYGWAVCCVAMALAVTYKENALLLGIPLMALFALVLTRREVNAQTFFWALVPLAASIPVSVVVLKVVMGFTPHVYGVSRSSVWKLLFQGNYLHVIGPFFLSFMLQAWFMWSSSVKGFKQSWIGGILLTGVCLVYATGDYLFCSGSVPTGSRYALPTHEAALIGLLPCVYQLKRTVHLLSGRWVNSLVLTAAVCSAAVFQVRLYLHNAKHVVETQNFKALLQEGRSAGRLLFITAEGIGSSYEQYYSLKSYVASGLTAKSLGYISLFADGNLTDFEKKLTSHIQKDINVGVPKLIANGDLLVTMDGGKLRRIEFYDVCRKSAQVIAERSGGGRNPLSLSDGVIFVPVVGGVVKSVVLRGNFSQCKGGVAFFLNGKEVLPSSVSWFDDMVSIFIDGQHEAPRRHPQIHELEMRRVFPALSRACRIDSVNVLQ